jgi:hypothetical protein
MQSLPGWIGAALIAAVMPAAAQWSQAPVEPVRPWHGMVQPQAQPASLLAQKLRTLRREDPIRWRGTVRVDLSQSTRLEIKPRPGRVSIAWRATL